MLGEVAGLELEVVRTAKNQRLTLLELYLPTPQVKTAILLSLHLGFLMDRGHISLKPPLISTL